MSLAAPITAPAAAPSAASSIRRRLVAAVVAAGAGSLLGVAAWLTPAAGGIGTHTQLALADCPWIVHMDLPCPTCGMTTAFAHAADGDLFAAFRTQPLGALFALGTAMTLLAALHIAATGSKIGAALRPLWGTRAAWLLGALTLIAWAYKIAAHRGLL